MKKKITAIVLIIISIMTMTVSANSVELTDTQKKELYEYGIFVGDGTGELRLNDETTRAEAVKIICVAGNFTADTYDKMHLFSDVPSNHWAFEYIHIAKDKGIISGDENGAFNPDKPVTNEEIIKMIITLLGYSPMADMKGGFPAGYTSQAENLSITENMQFDINTPAVRKNVAVMIYNALDIPLMQQAAYEGDGIFSIMNGKNGMPLITLRDNFI